MACMQAGWGDKVGTSRCRSLSRRQDAPRDVLPISSILTVQWPPLVRLLTSPTPPLPRDTGVLDLWREGGTKQVSSHSYPPLRPPHSKVSPPGCLVRYMTSSYHYVILCGSLEVGRTTAYCRGAYKSILRTLLAMAVIRIISINIKKKRQ